jgi:8-oxo-dGTP pyrophosphatase MutT (NUDIX family)
VATDDEVPWPDWLVARAREFAASGATPVQPRLAATVVLMRDASAGGFDVYAIRRASTMAFAAGMHAFPGGSVDPRDLDVQPDWAGPAPRVWAQRLALDEATACAVVCAAVREVFEESGVLLAGPDATGVVGDVSAPEWEAARVALLAREVGVAELLAARGLVLRSDLLAPWSHWITPEFEPRRFDTYFFLARLPAGQVTRDVGGEAAHALWAPPGDLLGLPMLPPTFATLRGLSAYPSIDAAMDAAADRDPAETQPKRPVM